MFSKDLVKWDRIKARLISLVYGEYFTDALRNTITIILPFSLLFFYHQPNMAIGVGVGALLISLTDSPGNRAHKFKSAIISIISFFFTALIISSSLGNPWLTAGSIFLLTFVFSMLAMFGSRMALIGTMAIILGIFTLGLHPENPLLFSWYILLGGYWYYLISLIQIVIWPYRSLHQAIFECITATSVFLKSKARYYDPEVNLEECYSETIALHIKVSEKQELVRNLLLSDKRAMKPTNERGQQLLRTAVSVIDLYEQVTAIHYDYAYVRKSLDKTGALNLIIDLIETLAEELQVLSGVFLRPKKTQSALRLLKFEQAREELSKLALSTDETNAHIILKVLKNLEGIVLHIQVIKQDQPMSAIPANLDSDEDIAYADFLSPQLFKLNALKQYFSFSSAVFRFSLRLALLCFLAYLINLVFPLGKYSYWLLLTIVIVAKPRFGLTWRRNVERLSGTLIGAVIGIVLLLIIHQIAALLIISAFLLLGFFTFNRIRYSVSVVCITAMVILCLSIYDGHSDHVIMERVIYTILGCAIAFLAAFLFPIWEIKGLKALISNILEANSNYLTKVKAELRGIENGIGVSKLARKNSYIQLAKFSETLQYMHLEPNSKALDMHGIYAIQILSYRINSIIASLSLSAKQYVKQDSGLLIVSEALSNMEYCVQHSNRLDLGKINEVLHADKIEEEYNDNEGTLQHQLNLLLALSVELKMYFI